MTTNGRTEFEQFLREQFGVDIKQHEKGEKPKHSLEELGKLVVSYILESNHEGWDGFDSRDRTGIDRLLRDMKSYYESGIKYDPDEFRRYYFTGTVMFPGIKHKFEPTNEQETTTS